MKRYLAGLGGERRSIARDREVTGGGDDCETGSVSEKEQTKRATLFWPASSQTSGTKRTAITPNEHTDKLFKKQILPLRQIYEYTVVL